MNWFQQLCVGQVYYDSVEKEEFCVVERKQKSWYVKRPHLKGLCRIYLVEDEVYIKWTQMSQSTRPLHLEHLILKN